MLCCVILLVTEQGKCLFLLGMSNERASSRQLLTLFTLLIKYCLSAASLLVYNRSLRFPSAFLCLPHRDFIPYRNHYFGVCIGGNPQHSTILSFWFWRPMFINRFHWPESISYKVAKILHDFKKECDFVLE